MTVGRFNAEALHPAGLFEARIADGVGAYKVDVRYPDGTTIKIDDPYRFWPTLGDLDLHLIGEGRHEQLWEALGAHHRVHEGDRRHRVRGVGAVGARGARGRRLQLVGRPHPPDAVARLVRRLGAVRARTSRPVASTSSRSSAPTGGCG